MVELVNKLKQLGLLGEELLYTSNGKEYVTRERAAAEARAAVRAAGGRIPLVDLPAQLGLDLVHCERAAEAVVASSGGAVTQAQGELFSTAYFDGLAAEVDEGLQEAGVASGERGVGWRRGRCWRQRSSGSGTLGMCRQVARLCFSSPCSRPSCPAPQSATWRAASAWAPR